MSWEDITIPSLNSSEISWENAAETNLNLGHSPAQIRRKLGVAFMQQDLWGRCAQVRVTRLVQGVGK